MNHCAHVINVAVEDVWLLSKSASFLSTVQDVLSQGKGMGCQRSWNPIRSMRLDSFEIWFEMRLCVCFRCHTHWTSRRLYWMQEDTFFFDGPKVAPVTNGVWELEEFAIMSDNSNIGSDWHLGHVVLMNVSEGVEMRFLCNDWLNKTQVSLVQSSRCCIGALRRKSAMVSMMVSCNIIFLAQSWSSPAWMNDGRYAQWFVVFCACTII